MINFRTRIHTDTHARTGDTDTQTPTRIACSQTGGRLVMDSWPWFIVMDMVRVRVRFIIIIIVLIIVVVARRSTWKPKLQPRIGTKKERRELIDHACSSVSAQTMTFFLFLSSHGSVSGRAW
ncbi:hypothetical protein BU24DRAFT_256998 [Aaosphaeria arxii CBS 175.79]|uniref:Uncharacterized protein n=1 Tax=Aaosphaeria arxii CBS 175.79 TaxID=1450172 RepID=A0A6A5XIA2_9PLEO|nr:uncharacterized protein BU24DRAFT_256998 [Aaosphaeria arxii CBS 175.79]KAF2012683.1 hypothetical protein BU24DRAFT_256998 [Aaosphaeria arxii CBS 175.79]